MADASNKRKKMNKTINLNFYRFAVIFFIAIFISLLYVAKSGLALNSEAPKKANVFLKWSLTQDETKKLAKWDLLVLDMENQITNPEKIRKIREINPDITILAYVTTQEIRDDALTGYSQLRKKLARKLYDDWYLKKPNGEKFSFWPGTRMLNVTNYAPKINGKRYNQILPEFMIDEIMSSNLWDGIFYDNAWDKLKWFTGDNVDLDGDGLSDNDLNRKWREGMKYIFNRTRRLARGNIILVGNGPNKAYSKELNGIIVENFVPDHLDWSQAMDIYSVNQNNTYRSPKTVIINSNVRNNGQYNSDLREMRYGLGSALMLDGYYSFDFGSEAHNQTWWYDEYEVDLGEARGEAGSASGYNTFKEDVWKRNFANGLALVNSTNQNKTVQLETEYEKINGTRAPDINDGSVVDKVDLPAKDGLVMLKSLQGTGDSQTVDDIVFENGSFMRFFDMNGNRVRNGFFVFDEEEPGGSLVYSGDLDGDKDKKEKITVRDSFRIKIYDDRGRELFHRYPFGSNSGNKFNLAVGSVFGDADKEIMFSSGGGERVMVVNHYGLMLNKGYYPFNNSTDKGFALAIGNVDGGERSENLLAFSNGNKQEVMIYNFRFAGLLNRFTIGYNAKAVRVASGDVNEDGRDEVIVGLNYNGRSVIKTYNFDGSKLAEFTVQTGFGGKLSELACMDADFDGADDIVMMSK